MIGTVFALQWVMKQKMSTQLIFFLGLLTLVVTGCGTPFDTEDYRATGAYQTKDPVLQGYLEGVEAIPVDTSTEKSIRISGLDPNIPQVEYQANIDISYNDISKTIELGEELAKQFLWPVRDCSKVGSWMDFRKEKSQYECGEIPYGQIINKNEKLMYTIKFDGLDGKTNGTSYDVSGANIPIYMRRLQKRSSDKIKHLSTKSTEVVAIDNGILDNIFYRFSSSEGALMTHVCFMSPGLQIHSDKTKIRVKAKKKKWFITLKGS
ncbi:MAG: hypothetical protein KDD22_05745, partial [Bdellovibrionales bacterium]|nr:hypothetical protein [Bdellovibrionales bacterium]